MDLIIIAGMPATGKSTLAMKVAEAFGYPILEKDEIKEALFDTVGYRDLPAKRQLDRAATAVLMQTGETLLKSGCSLIMVNNFESAMRDTVQKMVDRCGCRTVTVFFDGDPEVLYARYVERDAKKSRHLGHTFLDRYPPEPGDPLGLPMTRQYFADRFEKEGMADFKLNAPAISVDSTHPEKVDVEALIGQIRTALEEQA